MSRALTVVIAEDQEPDREKLVLYAKRLGLHVLSSVGSGKWFVEDCLKLKPDLVLMDIGLAELDGIAAYKRLVDQGLAPYLILVSGTKDSSLLLAGYELNVIGFVTKPVTFERLSAAVEKAVKAFERDLAHADGPADTRIIEIKSNHKPVFINENKLIYAERSKSDRKVQVYVAGEDPIVTRSSLSEIQVQCSELIFHPNKSQLVNLKYIDSVYASSEFFGTYTIKLTYRNTEIDLSRRKRKEFERLYSRMKG
ncbi:two component transcriptional regulator, LytTR family [Paenibacillus sp. UNCCL117]|uniref:LytR/AlgR family response regulator transcription factor n=1 Tax=unclassified Paenibacillus TaxID=185978 RepID=UPI000882E430|nr:MULTISPECIES: LytTR family DNA-binding domain-containing protein [unclassified Paenibacillus]SDD13952.1 DNA-binding response regulator, LytR/AlgR family [Paenibacillus sp. cl123]SFW34102.1 two component transcriptional regulator, LytTR family [Paenibacillus sp. UNCCL117]